MPAINIIRLLLLYAMLIFAAKIRRLRYDIFAAVIIDFDVDFRRYAIMLLRYAAAIRCCR